ncbi:hypothetical protein FBQ96_07050 [Nitrospirales bacterium NOB]|nr:hypothetical protein [Nitrospirales bacterium NOB]
MARQKKSVHYLLFVVYPGGLEFYGMDSTEAKAKRFVNSPSPEQAVAKIAIAVEDRPLSGILQAERLVG